MEQTAGGISESEAEEGGYRGSLPNVFASLRFNIKFVTDAGAKFGNGLMQALALFGGLKFQDIRGHIRGDLSGIDINFAGHVVQKACAVASPGLDPPPRSEIEPRTTAPQCLVTVHKNQSSGTNSTARQRGAPARHPRV